MKSKVSICLLYPDLLGTYADGGNATVLLQRLEWRGLAGEVLRVTMDETVPETCDIYLMGGGEDQPQSTVTDRLLESRALHRAVANNAVVFAVCAGMQLLGESFAVAGDKVKDGLGLLDVRTVRGTGERRVGELATQPFDEFGIGRLTGYENHGGVTQLGAGVRPFAKVLSGKGNDDGTGTDGAINGRVLGTYLHGPALARNSQLADLLLSWALGESFDSLKPLDEVDEEVDALRSERFAALGL